MEQILQVFFNAAIFERAWPFLARGVGMTVALSLVIVPIGLASGLAVAMLYHLHRRWLNRFLMAYVDFFRAMPLLLLILFSAFGLPKYGVNLPVFWYLVLALTAYNGAVLGEIFRAGILSLDRGQSEAAFSIGLGYWQAMLLVVIPQAARRMIPAIVSQLVTLLKDTSLGSVIAYEELLRRGRINGEYFHNTLQSLIVVAAMYIVVNFTLSRLARRLETRQRRRYQAGSISVTGVEDLAVLEAHTVAAASDATMTV